MRDGSPRTDALNLSGEQQYFVFLAYKTGRSSGSYLQRPDGGRLRATIGDNACFSGAVRRESIERVEFACIRIPVMSIILTHIRERWFPGRCE